MDEPYVSDELTHFVGQGRAPEEQFALLVDQILGPEPLLDCPGFDPLREGRITLGPTGQVSGNAKYRFPMICFCDIPLRSLGRHMRQYSEFGIAFAKPFLVAKGANPVFYVANGSRVTNAMDFLETRIAPQMGIRGTDDPYEKTATRAQLFDRLDQVFDTVLRRAFKDPTLAGSLGLTDLLLLQSYVLYLVFCHLKCFDESVTSEDANNFYLEREWRILEPVRFRLDDVARIILPDNAWAVRFRDARPTYGGHLTLASNLAARECINPCCNGRS